MTLRPWRNVSQVRDSKPHPVCQRFLHFPFRPVAPARPLGDSDCSVVIVSPPLPLSLDRWRQVLEPVVAGSASQER